jgi:lipopolysaccharide transport system ATP-binding protein
MAEIIIRADSLGKKYQIRHQQKTGGYVALRDVLSNTAGHYFRRIKGYKEYRNEVEEFWALKNLSFSIYAGDRVGIIGRNGAGKSTLLKVLSRITEPTTGKLCITGRIASLLEVGTGFHPELSGRENIFLNGAILGMSRNEIRKKFDEIVEFAEVEKFLDTPVKRYSSGMYVRLAFSVAAHLEQEILVVDEVLAVGDANFQRKCIGKMEDVSNNQGRTVLFVSHNMASIRALTNKGLILHKGSLVFEGDVEDAIKYYTQSDDNDMVSDDGAIKGYGAHTRIISVTMVDENGQSTSFYTPGKNMFIKLQMETDGQQGMSWDFILKDMATYTKIAYGSSYQLHGKMLPSEPGIYTYDIAFAPLNLASGTYSFDITTSIINNSWDHYVERALEFEVVYSNPTGTSWDFKSSYGYGFIAMICSSIRMDKNE